MISAIEEAYYEYIDKFLATQNLQKSKSVKFNSDEMTTLFSRKRSQYNRHHQSHKLMSYFRQNLFVSNYKVHRQHVTIFATQSTTIQDRAQNRKKKKNLTVKVVTGKPCLLLMKNSLIGIREIKILIRAWWPSLGPLIQSKLFHKDLILLKLLKTMKVSQKTSIWNWFMTRDSPMVCDGNFLFQNWWILKMKMI